jgi:dTDP-4-amino-4,6-dideoxygalactose transaminase
MAEIRKLSDFYGFKVIEDAAHAIGGSYKNQKIGSCSFSDVTIFSFHPVKIITTGEGGIAVTNDEALAQRIRLLSAHGIVRNSPLNPESSGRPGIWNYHQMSLGYNFRMTEFQAALGLSQVNRLEEFLSRRRQLVKKYNSALSDTGLGLPWQHPDSESSFHLYPVLIKQSQLGVSQRHFYDELINSGIGVNLHYIPVYLHPFYESKGFSAGLCPNAEQYFSETISLPLFSALSGEDQMAVITQVRRVLKL